MPSRHQSTPGDGAIHDQMIPKLDINLESRSLHPLKSPMHEGILDGAYYNDPTRARGGAIEWLIELLKPAIFKKGLPRRPVRGTAYLDGLRGWAAFMVYWHHHQLWPRSMILADRILENAWGFEDRYYFACIPFIRTFFSGGHFAVSIFFVISGYVLSTKPLNLIYAGEHEKLGGNMSSALFRRYLRLHIPVFCTTFVYMSFIQLFKVYTVAQTLESNYRDELWNWYMQFKGYSFAFRSGGEPWITYNFHAWSIPVEFKGSLIVYTCLLAFSRSTRNARLWCQVGLMFYFMYIVDGWYGSLFVAGMLLCELDALAKLENLPHFMMQLVPYKQAIFYAMFIVGMLIGGVPTGDQSIETVKKTPYWKYAAFLAPQAAFDYKWFYLFWASVLVVASIPRISWLKSFFETQFCQYLGRISYSLYLVHGPVLWVVADRLYCATGWWREANEANIPWWINRFPMSKAGPLGFEMSFLVPQLIILPLTLWLAEIVTTLFDEPSVKFSQWAYQQTLAPSAHK